jgi:hypothetical protein
MEAKEVESGYYRPDRTEDERRRRFSVGRIVLESMLQSIEVPEVANDLKERLEKASPQR